MIECIVKFFALRGGSAAAIATLVAFGAHVTPAHAAQNEVFYCTNQNASDGGTYAECGGAWTCGVPTTGNELTLRNYATNTLVRWSEISSSDTVPICGLAGGQVSTSASVSWISKASFEAGGGAVLQTAVAKKQPSAPPMVCIGKKCTNASASGTIKWNPGQYMASIDIESSGSSATSWSTSQDALAALASSPGVIGFRAFVYWGTVEGPGEGQYNFALIDSLLSKLAAMSPQRHLVLVVLPGLFSGSSLAGRTDVLPSYILNGAQYGPSPVSGSYGWWGGSTNSQPPVAAIHRQAVAQAYGKMLAAIASHYDGNPLFEGLMVQEDSWMYGASYYNPSAPDFSSGAFMSNLQAALSMAVAAAPHTTIAMQNTWAGDVTATQNFETWLYDNRILPAETDTRAASLVQKNGMSWLSWGLDAYVGLPVSGSSWSGPDMRPMTHAWCDVEGTELGYPISGYTGQNVLDIVNGINQDYQCSHAFWTFMPNGFSSSPSWAWWPNLAPVIKSNALANTSYPKNYP